MKKGIGKKHRLNSQEVAKNLKGKRAGDHDLQVRTKTRRAETLLISRKTQRKERGKKK